MTTTTKTKAKPAPVVDLYSGEFGDTLTGFDEVAIGKAFGATLDELAARGGLAGVRALIFVHRRREGDDDKAAKVYAMDATRSEVAAYFAGLGMPDVESDEDEGKD